MSNGGSTRLLLFFFFIAPLALVSLNYEVVLYVQNIYSIQCFQLEGNNVF